jgi:hypothetical protein
MLVAICQAHNASGPKALNDQSNDIQSHSNFMQNIVSRYLEVKRSITLGTPRYGRGILLGAIDVAGKVQPGMATRLTDAGRGDLGIQRRAIDEPAPAGTTGGESSGL